MNFKHKIEINLTNNKNNIMNRILYIFNSLHIFIFTINNIRIINKTK